jgi:hypothetical protein
MSLKSLISGVVAGFLPLASGSVTPGKVTANHDEFKGSTTITLMGQQAKGQPILYSNEIIQTDKPKQKDSPILGFLVKSGCPHPNFLADGKRVVPSPGSDTVPGVSLENVKMTTGKMQHYMFVFNFYDREQIQQIASAKSVQYQICKKVYTLAAPDQEYLQQFLTQIKSN